MLGQDFRALMSTYQLFACFMSSEDLLNIFPLISTCKHNTCLEQIHFTFSVNQETLGCLLKVFVHENTFTTV